MKTILIIDEDAEALAVAEAALGARYIVRGYPSLAAAEPSLRDASVPRADVILVDEVAAAPDGALQIAMALAPDATVVLAGKETVGQRAIGWIGRPSSHERTPRSQPLRVSKPYAEDTLRRVVRLASATSACARASARVAPDAVALELVGTGPLFEALRRRIALYARSEEPVLIVGESGTGKELAAAAVHRASPRRGGRLVPVDCAALPDTLAESALFGTVRGAFTDAVETKGAFESARGGTLFLDEIGELRPRVQAKFLRAIESGTGCRVGSHEAIGYDVRIVSATNVHLGAPRSRFRPELLHRIDTLVLEMPPLRAHKDDIAAISRRILEGEGRSKRLDEASLARLMAWDWPGNVRELRNVLRRAAVLSGEEELIRPSYIEIGGYRRVRQPTLF